MERLLRLHSAIGHILHLSGAGELYRCNSQGHGGWGGAGGRLDAARRSGERRLADKNVVGR